MTGTIKSMFPKPGERGTWIIVISPEDGSPDIFETMKGVSGKPELPDIGSEVGLKEGFPTWEVKS